MQLHWTTWVAITIKDLKKKELWQYMKQKDRMLFSWMRRGIMGSAMNLPGKGGRKIIWAAVHGNIQGQAAVIKL